MSMSGYHWTQLVPRKHDSGNLAANITVLLNSLGFKWECLLETVNPDTLQLTSIQSYYNLYTNKR